MLALFPPGARVAAGVLELEGLPATELAERFGTPLVVYSEPALRERARLFVRAAPGALVVYGTKAFPNVAVMRLLAEEGIGADVSTLGELTFARRAGIAGERLVVHGNNKSDEELRAAAEADALVVLDALDEADARGRGRRPPGARPRHARRRHRDPRGDPDRASRLEVRSRRRRGARSRSPPHAQPGSTSRACTSTSARSSRTVARTCEAVELLGEFATRCRDELDWTPASSTSAAASGSATSRRSRNRRSRSSSRSIADAVASEWTTRGLPAPRLSSSPAARSSDPPRSRSTASAPSSTRATRATSRSTAACRTTRGRSSTTPATRRCSRTAPTRSRTGDFTIAGKHCESGDVLIEQAVAPGATPRRSDRGARDRRLHALDELELQRRPAAGRRPRQRCARRG